MIIPVRCYTCNKLVAHLWEGYETKLDEGTTKGQALNELGLRRLCCRRMFLGHVDLIDHVLQLERIRRKEPK